MWFGATQGYETTHYWNERMKFESIALPLEYVATRCRASGRDLVRQLADYGNLAIFGVQVRARAHGARAAGRVRRAAIEYDMTDEDVRTLKVGVKRLIEMMFAAGAREVFPGVHGLPDRIGVARDRADVRLARRSAALPLHRRAPLRHGEDGPERAEQRRGPELESHELPGLYVLDSSVFPTNMGVNPQHTICALSWLAAERIAGRARSRSVESAAGRALLREGGRVVEQMDVRRVAAHGRAAGRTVAAEATQSTPQGEEASQPEGPRSPERSTRGALRAVRAGRARAQISGRRRMPRGSGSSRAPPEPEAPRPRERRR